jgi:hypothetical protein
MQRRPQPPEAVDDKPNSHANARCLPSIAVHAQPKLPRGRRPALPASPAACNEGQETTIEAHGTTLRILAVPAHHCHDDETIDRELGRGNGYILEWHGPHASDRAYWRRRRRAVRRNPRVRRALRARRLVIAPPGGNRWRRLLWAADDPIEALEQRAQENGLTKRFTFLEEGARVSL